MAKNGGVFRHILIWTYERGTLQYDIICALILAFIFLVPRSCFTARKQQSDLTDRTQISRPVQSSQPQR